MKVEIKMPQLGESVAEGKVLKWLKGVGETVERDENLLEVMTDKVTVEIPSIVAGKLVEVLVQEEEVAQVGAVLAYLEAEGEAAEAEQPAAEKAATTPPPPKAPQTSAAPKEAKKPKSAAKGERDIPPGVQTLADQLGVDLALVEGSGEAGRVRKKDLLDYLAKNKEGSLKEPEAVLNEGDELIPLTGMRQAIAEHMVLSKRTIPHVMTAHEVDMSAVVATRAASDPKVSVTAYIAQATAAALRKFPEVNSQFTSKGILRRKAVHLGIAVATEAGLLVPSLRDADQKSLTQLHAEIKDLAERSRNNKLKPDEVSGATFTITNPGVFNSLISAPVIPYGQSGILGVGTMKQRPVVVDGKVEVRPIMILSISFDHRTLDGAIADLFLEEIRKNLEQIG